MQARIEQFARDAGSLTGKLCKSVYLLGKLAVDGALILWDVARMWWHRKDWM